MAASSDPKKHSEVRVFGSSDELATGLVEYVAQLSDISIKEKKMFCIALSGQSLIRLMGKLGEAPYNTTVDWSNWYVFWAEEHVVAKDHVDSNYKLTMDKFLSKVPVHEYNVHSIDDTVTGEEAAAKYESSICFCVRFGIIDTCKSTGMPMFDLVLLTMDSTGQFGSFFHHSILLQEKEKWVACVATAPHRRITFTLPVINAAYNVAVVATGNDKARVLDDVVSHTSAAPGTYPVQLIRPTNGKLVWFLDQPAATYLDNGHYDGSSASKAGLSLHICEQILLQSRGFGDC